MTSIYDRIQNIIFIIVCFSLIGLGFFSFFHNSAYAYPPTATDCNPSLPFPCQCWSKASDGNPVWCGNFLPSSNGVNPPGMSGGCKVDNDCCFNRNNITLPPSDLANHCVDYPSSSSATPTPSPSANCSSDTQCPAGQICNGSGGSCTCSAGTRPGTCPTNSCSNDTQCPAGKVCNTAGSSCSCQTGQGPGTCPTNTCSNDAQCKTGQVCNSAGGSCSCQTGTGTAGTCPTNQEALCKCNGLSSTGIIKGQPTTYTAHELVVGTNPSAKKVADIQFFVAQNVTNGDESNVPIIAQSGPVTPTLDSTSSAGLDYVAQWNYTTPQDLPSNQDFRVFSKANCTSVTAMTANQQTLFLPAQTNTGFLGAINSFLLRLLEPFTVTTPQIPGSTQPASTPIVTQNSSPSNSKQQLSQLIPAFIETSPGPSNTSISSNSTNTPSGGTKLNDNQLNSCQFIFKFPSQ